MCDFERAFVAPEMRKVRQVVVLSITRMNHRHADQYGVCTVVPVSSVPPDSPGPEDVLIPQYRYWSFTKESWIKCSMIANVSHARLDLVLRNGRRHPSEFLIAEDMATVEKAVSHVLGLG
jgi:uncharacterized protein YifN (PemK superfamily)